MLKKLDRLKRQLLNAAVAALLLIGSAGTAQAADYVFMYNGGYLAVNNSGTIVYVTSFSPQCVWTCVSSTSTLDAATLGTTSRFLYATDGNGTRRWLVGGTGDGTAITTTTTAPGTARWQNNNNRLYWSQTYTYYAYYKGSTWRTSRRTNGNSYGDGAYYSGNGSGTDYRSTTYSVTTTTVIDLSTNPTINGDNILTTTGDHSYTATGAVFRVGYKNYYFSNTDHYVDANGDGITPANATIGTPTWNLTSNSYATVNSSGVVNVSSLPESDITLTLTATVTATGGVPAAPANTTLTNTKEITIQGTKPSAPTISINGTSVTMSTNAAGSTSIRYTLDGSNPTVSTGTVYSGAIDLSGSATSPVTIKAVTVRNGNASDVSTETVTLTLPAPTITANAAAGTATISSSVAGATIYYTTNGSEPTTSSSQYTSSLSGLSLMTTIKAIAVKSGWNNSPVASELLTISSNVTDNVVTLFDYEDHTWSYYQASGDLPTGYPSELHSPDPRNVKITYKGNGQYTNGNAVSGVKVGVDADAHTFVYYKTLEKGTDDKYAYTTIPNPFSVRPKSGTTYYGFSHWKVTSISGGTIDGYALNSSINAETEIKFVPSGTYTTNCTSMEVVLEAVWDVAEVSTSGTFTNDYGVERMFYVVAGGNTNLASANKACTYSSFYPNGTTNGTDAATLSNRVTRYAGFSATYDSKIEYIILRNNTSTLNANGKNFTVGRGVEGYNGGVCATNLYGLAAASTTSFKFRVESGTYTNLYFLGKSYNFTNNAKMTTILGCDYDRAKVEGGDDSYNEKLHVSEDIALGYNATAGNNSNKGAEIFHCTVKSGNYDLGTSNYGGEVQFYLSVWGNNPVTYGKRTLIVEGGVFSDISGGTEDDGTTTVMMVDIRIKGGTMNSAVYGAAQKSEAEGHRRMIITGGDFKGWIAGGANGNATGDNYNGEMTGNSFIYVGGNANVNSGNNTVINRAVGGNVFGAGCGYGSGYSSGLVTGNTNVVIADNATIERGVYGGGSYGYTTQTSNIYILGGTINGRDGGVNGTSYLASIDGGVYGGACQNQGGTVNITMNGGTVNGSVYGGSNYTGTLSGTSTVTLNGGTINGSLYGGGNGEGSASTNVTGAVSVTVNGGSVTGAVYGCNNNQGAPQNTVTVTINGTDPAPSANSYAIGAVFGGGNQANYTYGTPTVTVNNCDNSIEYVYGGGNAATVTGTNVTINGGNKIGNVFGGCYGANVTTNGTKVTINGGTIEKVFGGNNQSGTITGAINVYVDKTGSCPMKIGELYGGGNIAGSAVGNLHIGCTGDLTAAHATANETDNRIGYELEGIGDVYGGANAAAVTGNVNLTIDSGMVYRVFGANNTSNTVSGTVTVTINQKTDNCGWYVGYVYGGGNMAPYGTQANPAGNYPVVNVKAGLVSHNVYGGGKGNTATVTGNPQVTLSGTAEVGGNVYGGGDAAPVTGSTKVTLKN